jgi:hypothetical protein
LTRLFVEDRPPVLVGSFREDFGLLLRVPCLVDAEVFFRLVVGIARCKLSNPKVQDDVTSILDLNGTTERVAH